MEYHENTTAVDVMLTKGRYDIAARSQIAKENNLILTHMLKNPKKK